MLELYYWMWRLLGFGVVLALLWAAWCAMHKVVFGPSRNDAVARGLLTACRDCWEAGGSVVFRDRRGKERTLKRC